MIVVDASAALDGLLDPVRHDNVVEWLSGSEDSLASPDLIDVEVLSVLRRWERTADITGPRARQALDDLGTLPIIRYPARALTDRVWKLRHNLTAYDAEYVALAQALPARLLTMDQRMAGAAAKLRIEVLDVR